MDNIVNIFNVKSTLGANLSDVRDYIASAVPKDKEFATALVFEEAFVNIVNYAYPNKIGDIEIRFWIKDNNIYLELIDEGIPFNPTNYISRHLDSNNCYIGGHGIRIIKEMSQNIIYSRTTDNKNKMLIII